MWFKPKYSVCQECQCLYIAPENSEFPYYCAVHRAKPEELSRRRKAVIEWAMQNWLKLEKQENEEMMAKLNAYNGAQQAQMNEIGQQAASMQSQAQAQAGYGALGAMSGIWPFSAGGRK